MPVCVLGQKRQCSPRDGDAFKQLSHLSSPRNSGLDVSILCGLVFRAGPIEPRLAFNLLFKFRMTLSFHISKKTAGVCHHRRCVPTMLQSLLFVFLRQGLTGQLS